MDREIGSRMVEKAEVGVPINVARELMGHSSISVTAEIYTHSSPESFQDARDKINQLARRRS